MSRQYFQSDIKVLWGLAAGRCGFPDCRVECAEEATAQDRAVPLGEMAHIVAHANQGPRADPAYPAELRDRYENLILLCAHHHELVDKQENTYTIDDLRHWKAGHELWVRGRLTAEIPSITFAEMEMVTKGLLAAPLSEDYSFTLTTPRDKLNRNGLTERVNFLVTIGFSKVREVAKFVNFIGQVVPDFGDALKAGFIGKYNELKEQGIEGDALFEALHQFASGDSRDFRHQAAGLAVLMYLFEICEVFER